MKNLSIFLFLIASHFTFASEIPLQIEFATTLEQRTFGLMNRKNLDENEGMLFIYPKKERLQLWMFNCFIDLSVAFLNETGVIEEIVELKAYPEKMEKIPPIQNYEELKNRRIDPLILQFYLAHSIHSTSAVKYALEMNGLWFYNHGVKVGDTLLFKLNQREANIKKSSK